MIIEYIYFENENINWAKSTFICTILMNLVLLNSYNKTILRVCVYLYTYQYHIALNNQLYSIFIILPIIHDLYKPLLKIILVANDLLLDSKSNQMMVFINKSTQR